MSDTYFVFASDFYREISEVAAHRAGERIIRSWPVYVLTNEEIGNLMAAIHGVDLRGFIGDIYRLFPFPAKEDDFAQNPEGHMTRDAVTRFIERYCPPSRVAFAVDASGSTVEIGDYVFTREVFRELLRYVWLGGYPKWKNGQRPDYVVAMVESLSLSCHPLFQGMAPFI